MNGKKRTEEQLAALREAYALLDAQFDDLLIVCATRADHETVGADPDVFWKGHFMVAKGLADFANDRISFSKRSGSKPK